MVMRPNISHLAYYLLKNLINLSLLTLLLIPNLSSIYFYLYTSHLYCNYNYFSYSILIYKPLSL